MPTPRVQSPWRRFTARLRQCACVAPDRQAIFFICAHCDGGHSDISETYRQHTHRRQRRGQDVYTSPEQGLIRVRDPESVVAEESDTFWAAEWLRRVGDNLPLARPNLL